MQLTLFLSIFFSLYGLINYYIALRGWQAFNSINNSHYLSWCWAAAVALLAVSYPLGRFLADLLPHDLSRIVIYIGSYWLAAMYYLFLILLVCDLLRAISGWAGILPSSLRDSFNVITLGVLALVGCLLLIGTWISLNPVVRNYEVTLNKKSSTIDSMRVVVVSDIHLGWIVGLDRLKYMTDIINSLEPDLVLLPGDIIDEGLDLAAEQELPEIMRSLHPRFGTFAAMGNHEYISGNPEATIELLNRAGVKVLRDQWAEVTEGFYVLGRDDASRHRFNAHERVELSTLMADVDKDKLPVILMDHEPFNLEISDKEGIDLQFSGHTHLGQLFPNNYITNAIYEQDWGYLRKDNLQIIVSSGYGTWGPPIRIGNRPEVVNVLVHFAPAE
ncbi:MAG: metallophosphoesterase [Syntrophomonas sp.]|nr:metallophosphoesterase [Syntrophomonas sp.]